jgi:hypothetical protein
MAEEIAATTPDLVVHKKLPANGPHRMDDGIDVYLGPRFSEPRNIQEYLDNQGFEDFTRFQAFDDYCIVRFSKPDRALAFSTAFNGRAVNGKILEAYIVPQSGAATQTVRPPRIASHTISVKGYPPELLTDRNLWDHFCRVGFIRQIECRGDTGFIQFDTEDDAQNAFEDMDDATVGDAVIRVNVVPDMLLNLPNVVIPLAIEDMEEQRVPVRPRERDRQTQQQRPHDGHRGRRRRDRDKAAGRPRDRVSDPRRSRAYEQG